MDKYNKINDILENAQYTVIAILESGFQTSHGIENLIKDMIKNFSKYGFEEGKVMSEKLIELLSKTRNGSENSLEDTTYMYMRLCSYIEECKRTLKKEIVRDKMKKNIGVD